MSDNGVKYIPHTWFSCDKRSAEARRKFIGKSGDVVDVDVGGDRGCWNRCEMG